MKDDILEKAIARRDELQRELEEINKFIRTYERLAESKMPPRGFIGRAMVAARIPSVSAAIPAPRTPTKEVLDKVTGILLVENRPVKPKELYDRLALQGVVIAGEKPANNLSAMLSGAKDRFKSVPGGGWVLTGKVKDLFS